MAHNLKPNTEYVILTLQVAVTKSDFDSGAYADGIIPLMDIGMFDNNDGLKSGVIGDWQFTPESTVQVNQKQPVLVKTGDNVTEGEIFQ